MTTLANPSLEDVLRLACLMEATTRKPGNVHPQASFDDLTYADFVTSAAVAAPVLARSADLGVGRAVFEAVRATRDAVGRNTNLGMALLLAPLAAVPIGQSLKDGLRGVLAALTVEDARYVYQAIRLVGPGGIGRVDAQDISLEPTVTLLEAMRLAAGRDAVAAQYATGFALVLEFGVPILERRSDFENNWEPAVIDLHLRLLVRQPDSLIARKCGIETARASAARAEAVLAAGGLQTDAGRAKLEEFDHWLRADGHRRNPGTTADLVAACLFAALRDDRVHAPDID